MSFYRFYRWLLCLLKIGFDELQTPGEWCSLFYSLGFWNLILVPSTKSFILAVSFGYYTWFWILQPRLYLYWHLRSISSLTVLMYHLSVPISTDLIGRTLRFPWILLPRFSLDAHSGLCVENLAKWLHYIAALAFIFCSQVAWRDLELILFSPLSTYPR